MKSKRATAVQTMRHNVQGGRSLSIEATARLKSALRTRCRKTYGLQDISAPPTAPHGNLIAVPESFNSRPRVPHCLSSLVPSCQSQWPPTTPPCMGGLPAVARKLYRRREIHLVMIADRGDSCSVKGQTDRRRRNVGMHLPYAGRRSLVL